MTLTKCLLIGGPGNGVVVQANGPSVDYYEAAWPVRKTHHYIIAPFVIQGWVYQIGLLRGHRPMMNNYELAKLVMKSGLQAVRPA